jgi:hypothetical protein
VNHQNHINLKYNPMFLLYDYCSCLFHIGLSRDNEDYFDIYGFYKFPFVFERFKELVTNNRKDKQLLIYYKKSFYMYIANYRQLHYHESVVSFDEVPKSFWNIQTYIFYRKKRRVSLKYNNINVLLI